MGYEGFDPTIIMQSLREFILHSMINSTPHFTEDAACIVSSGNHYLGKGFMG